MSYACPCAQYILYMTVSSSLQSKPGFVIGNQNQSPISEPILFFLKPKLFFRFFGFRGPFMIEIIPHTIGNWNFPLKFGFGVGYSIERKYRPIWVSVLVLHLNQNSGFGF